MNGSDKAVPQESVHQEKGSEQGFSKEYKEQHIRPWPRFFARYIDIYLFSLVLGVLSAVFYPLPFSTNNVWLDNMLVGLALIFLWFVFEPFFLCLFGATLGKFLFNIKVRDLNGNKLKLGDAYKRCLGVWVVGLGLGIPGVSPLTMAVADFRLHKTGTTYWDKDRFIVTHGKIGFLRSMFIVLVCLMLVGIGNQNKIERYYYSTFPEKFAADIAKKNKQLPIMIDSDTEFTSMAVDGNTLIYQYKLVNIDGESINKDALYGLLREAILKNACDRSDPDPAMALGYHFSFVYNDRNNTPIFSVDIQPSDCDIKSQ